MGEVCGFLQNGAAEYNPDCCPTGFTAMGLAATHASAVVCLED
jgi:hypothetical protein